MQHHAQAYLLFKAGVTKQAAVPGPRHRVTPMEGLLGYSLSTKGYATLPKQTSGHEQSTHGPMTIDPYEIPE